MVEIVRSACPQTESPIPLTHQVDALTTLVIRQRPSIPLIIYSTGEKAARSSVAGPSPAAAAHTRTYRDDLVVGRYRLAPSSAMRRGTDRRRGWQAFASFVLAGCHDTLFRTERAVLRPLVYDRTHGAHP